MKNLRCHSLLSVPLCLSTNFIGGGNGSGKSTVLLAIQLALGMKVPEGTGVVRADCKDGTAEAQVVLSNVGPEGTSFMRHLYGDAITLKRTISLNPATGKTTASLEIEGAAYLADGKKHKVKGAEAKTVLAALCMCFNIAHDNPVMIMDQETSKKFLTGNPKEQYDYYMRATNLLSHYNQIADLKEKLEVAAVGLHNHEQALAAAKAQEQEILKDYKDVQDLRHLDQRIIEAEKDLAWAQYVEASKQGEPYRKEEEDAKKAHLAARERWEKVTQALPGFEAKVKAAKERVEEAQSKTTELTDKISAAAQAAKDAQRPVAQKTKRRNTVKEAERKAEKAFVAAQRQLKAVEDSIAAAMANSRVTKAKLALEEALQRSAVLDAENVSADKEMSRLEEELEAAEEPHRAAKGRLEEARRAARGADERLANLGGAGARQAGPLDAFKASNNDATRAAADIAALVAGAPPHTFSTPPLGPLGALLRLKDPELGPPLEASRRKALTTFLCASNEDGAALDALVRNHKGGALARHLAWRVFSDKQLHASLEQPQALPKDCLYHALVLESPCKLLANSVAIMLRAADTLWVKEGADAAEARLRSLSVGGGGGGGGGGAGGGGGGGEGGGKRSALCPTAAGVQRYVELSLGGAGSLYRRHVYTGGIQTLIRGANAASDLAAARGCVKLTSEALKAEEAAVAALGSSLKSVSGELTVARGTLAKLAKDRERVARAMAEARRALKEAEKAAEEMTEEEAKRADAAQAVDAALDDLNSAKAETAEAEAELAAAMPLALAAERAVTELEQSHAFKEEADAEKDLEDKEAGLEKVKKAMEDYETKANEKEGAHDRAAGALAAFEGSLGQIRDRARAMTGMAEPRPGGPETEARAGPAQEHEEAQGQGEGAAETQGRGRGGEGAQGRAAAGGGGDGEAPRRGQQPRRALRQHAQLHKGLQGQQGDERGLYQERV